MAACNKSLTGTSQKGAGLGLPSLNRCCKFRAMTTRADKSTNAVIAHKVFANKIESTSQIRGQRAPLDKMLKKYDVGMQTRIVRAQRS